MPRLTILATGTSAADSTDFVIAASESVKVGVFASTPSVLRVQFTVYEVTPGAANIIGRLGNETRSILISAPGSYRVARPLIVDQPFGVYTDDGK
jgi:hypothetical protein